MTCKVCDESIVEIAINKSDDCPHCNLWEVLVWLPIAEEEPDDDAMVLLFDPDAPEPVWPGYLSDGQWLYAYGSEANPTHWAEMPFGPRRVA